MVCYSQYIVVVHLQKQMDQEILVINLEREHQHRTIGPQPLTFKNPPRESLGIIYRRSVRARANVGYVNSYRLKAGFLHPANHCYMVSTCSGNAYTLPDHNQLNNTIESKPQVQQSSTMENSDLSNQDLCHMISDMQNQVKNLQLQLNDQKVKPTPHHQQGLKRRKSTILGMQPFSKWKPDPSFYEQEQKVVPNYITGRYEYTNQAYEHKLVIPGSLPSNKQLLEKHGSICKICDREGHWYIHCTIYKKLYEQGSKLMKNTPAKYENKPLWVQKLDSK
ncbi:hypothetical protein BY996DRAFT_6518640 [Phakopsora pachyrhizi]|nr:hypothetical protein BY996DRAFT_6518640 [Phakopsora pachyrhizi]